MGDGFETCSIQRVERLHSFLVYQAIHALAAIFKTVIDAGTKYRTLSIQE